MATAEERLQLRRNTGEVGSTTYSDDEMDTYILDAGGDLDVASAKIWGEKAASYAELVDMTEAGSSRKNSDLFKNAEAMRLQYATKSGTSPSLAPGSFSTTRKIVRA